MVVFTDRRWLPLSHQSGWKGQGECPLHWVRLHSTSDSSTARSSHISGSGTLKDYDSQGQGSSSFMAQVETDSLGWSIN